MAKITEATVESSVPKVTSKWDAFVKAGLKPVEIICEGYKPTHRVDNGCHSRLQPNVDQMLRHLDGGHGGGFRIKMVKTDGKPWPGWNDFGVKGVECLDCRCDVCDKELALNPQVILKHLFTAHTGKTRRPIANANLMLTISFNRPIPHDNDEDDFQSAE